MTESNVASLFYWLGGAIMVAGAAIGSSATFVAGAVILAFPVLKHKV